MDPQGLLGLDRASGDNRTQGKLLDTLRSKVVGPTELQIEKEDRVGSKKRKGHTVFNPLPEKDEEVQ